MLTPSTGKIEPSELIQQFLRHMDELRSVPAAQYASPSTFVHNDLKDTTHAFLKQDALRRALDPPYNGQYKVLGRTEKNFKKLMLGWSINVSADRVNPTYMLVETNYEPISASNPSASSTQSAVEPDATPPPVTRPHALAAPPLPDSLRAVSSHLREGVMWEISL